MEPTLHLNEFFVEGNNPEDSHVLLNITEPSTEEEKSKGYFFAICEINGGDARYITKLQNIIDEIENSYYEISDQNDKTSLEAILDKINQESFSVIKEGVALHCIVGALRKNDIIFSFYGQPQLVLFYKTKNDEYKKMDLVMENQSAEQAKSRTDSQSESGTGKERAQLFSQLVEGKIGPNDYFFVGTPHITEYFSHDRLQKIITSRPPRQSAEHLQGVLSELKNNFSFGGIIIHLQKTAASTADAKHPPSRKGDSAQSLRSLFSTEQTTANIMSPSFLPRLGNRFASILKKEESAEETAKEPSYPAEINSIHSHPRRAARTPAQTKGKAVKMLVAAAKTAWILAKMIFRGLLWILILLGSILQSLAQNTGLLFIAVINYKNRRQSILADWARQWRLFRENIKRLPLITKILFIASILLVLIFSGSIVYLNAAKKKTQKAKAFEAAMQEAGAKKSDAESYLVYLENEKALAQLTAASEILSSLDCVAQGRQQDCAKLADEINAMLQKARGVKQVKAAILTDWGAAADIGGIFLSNGKIYAYGGNTSTLLSYDLLSKESSTINPAVSANGFKAAAVPKENDYILLLYANNKLAEYDPQDYQWKNIEIDFPAANALISDIFVYNRKLYALDVQNNVIYKHDPTKAGFGKGKEWTASPDSDLAQGADMAIDGDLFALTKNGGILKFAAGQKQPFDLKGVDPKLTSGNFIWTYTDLNYLYILDRAGSRILVANKNGELVSQLVSPDIAGPSGMIIDEAKSVGYVVAGGKLFKIGL